MIMLAKSKSNSIELKIYKDLIDSVISHYKFVLINNVKKNMMKRKKK